MTRPICDRVAAAVGLIAAAVLSLACGAGGGMAGSAAVTAQDGRSIEQDGVLARACRGAQRRAEMSVRCPAWLPGHDRDANPSLDVRRLDLGDGRDAYLFELHRDDDGRRPFHVLFGGRARPLALDVVRSSWPARLPSDDELRLIGSRQLEPGDHAALKPVRLRVLRRTTVAAKRALLLRAAPFPDGGVHGGHHVIVWNDGGHGYAVSMHFPTPTDGDGTATPAQIRMLRRAAGSMTPAR